MRHCHVRWFGCLESKRRSYYCSTRIDGVARRVYGTARKRIPAERIQQAQ